MVMVIMKVMLNYYDHDDGDDDDDDDDDDDKVCSRDLLARFMEDHPDLSLEEAANPERMVRTRDIVFVLG